MPRLAGDDDDDDEENDDSRILRDFQEFYHHFACRFLYAGLLLVGVRFAILWAGLAGRATNAVGWAGGGCILILLIGAATFIGERLFSAQTLAKWYPVLVVAWTIGAILFWLGVVLLPVVVLRSYVVDCFLAGSAFTCGVCLGFYGLTVPAR